MDWRSPLTLGRAAIPPVSTTRRWWPPHFTDAELDDLTEFLLSL